MLRTTELATNSAVFTVKGWGLCAKRKELGSKRRLAVVQRRRVAQPATKWKSISKGVQSLRGYGITTRYHLIGRNRVPRAGLLNQFRAPHQPAVQARTPIGRFSAPFAPVVTDNGRLLRRLQCTRKVRQRRRGLLECNEKVWVAYLCYFELRSEPCWAQAGRTRLLADACSEAVMHYQFYEALRYLSVAILYCSMTSYRARLYLLSVSDTGAGEGTLLVQHYHLVLARDVAFHQALR